MPELFFDWDEVGRLLEDASSLLAELRGGEVTKPPITRAEEMPEELTAEALVFAWRILDSDPRLEAFRTVSALFESFTEGIQQQNMAGVRNAHIGIVTAVRQELNRQNKPKEEE